MIPFRPEPFDKMRARYGEAISYVSDPQMEGERPGVQRRHVFDFFDGVRVIVSRDLIDTEPRLVTLHVSASFTFEWGNAQFARWADAHGASRQALDLICARLYGYYADLSGDKVPMKLYFLSGGKGVPHWCRDEVTPQTP